VLKIYCALSAECTPDRALSVQVPNAAEHCVSACCVGIKVQKVHFIQQEARRQGKRVYRVDIDLKNTFNAMSQAALWQVMRMFKISDVELLEQI